MSIIFNDTTVKPIIPEGFDRTAYFKQQNEYTAHKQYYSVESMFTWFSNKTGVVYPSYEYLSTFAFGSIFYIFLYVLVRYLLATYLPSGFNEDFHTTLSWWIHFIDVSTIYGGIMTVLMIPILANRHRFRVYAELLGNSENMRWLHNVCAVMLICARMFIMVMTAVILIYVIWRVLSLLGAIRDNVKSNLNL